MLPTPLYAAFLAATVTLFALSSPADATPFDPFEGCQSQTGRNATVLLRAPAQFFLIGLTQQADPLAAGDEVAALTPQGVCAGFVVWEDHTTLLSVWEDDPLTPYKDGFTPGDPLTLWVRDASSGWFFISAQVSYQDPFDTSGQYSTGAVFAPYSAVFYPVFLRNKQRAPNNAKAGADQAERNAQASRSAHTNLATAPPDDYVLAASYPNPFRSSTTVRYGLPEEAAVRLEVYDSLGRSVTTLVDEVQTAGWHEAVLPARGLTAGLYVVRLRAGDFVSVRRVTLVR